MGPPTRRENATGGFLRERDANAACVVIALLVTTSDFGCRRNEPAPTPSPPTSEPERKPERLVFPDELRVADASVNEFVDRAMRTIAQGEYEPFRALWSVRNDPPSSADFDKGWQAVRSIRVVALEKVMIATESDRQAPASTGEAPSGAASPIEISRAPDAEHSYALLAEIDLDPKNPATRDEPTREVVLVMIREQGEWRMVRAPKALRNWLLERAGKSPGRTETPSPSHTGG